MAESGSRAFDSAFPIYHDGDVLVVLSPTRHYQLHSHTLRKHSAFFAQVLAEDAAANLSSKARREGTVVRYRIELQHPLEGNAGELALRQLDSEGRAVGHYNGPSSGANLSDAYSFWDNLFRVYYQKSVTFGEESITAVLFAVIGLVEAAEYAGSLTVITSSIDNALTALGQKLYRSISTNALVWADVAVRVESEFLFKEAITHIVGQWNVLKHRDDIEPSLRKLCEEKATALDNMKQDVEKALIGYYPTHLQVPQNANVGIGSKTLRNKGQPTRSTAYAQDIMVWMAMNLFRHYIGQQIATNKTRYADDGGYNFYIAVKTGGVAYITHGDVEHFVGLFPLSAKSRHMFDNQLELIKAEVSEKVDELLQNHSRLDVRRTPVRYLTCTWVEKKEIPWVKAAVVAEEQRRLAAAAAFSNASGEPSDGEIDQDDNELHRELARAGKKRRKMTGNTNEGNHGMDEAA